MQLKPLLPGQSVTVRGDTGSQELLEVIQRLVGAVSGQATQIAALTARLNAVAAVAAPTGGATVDTQARTAINAIRTAAA